METRQVLNKLLEITEDSPDGLKYLQFFRSQSKERFALVYPSSESVLESWDILFHDLKILHQLNLYPIVVLNSSLPSYIKTFLKSSFQGENNNIFPLQLIRRPENLLKKVIETIEIKNRIPIILIPRENDNQHNLVDFIPKILKELNSNKLILLNEKAGIRKKDSSRYSIINLSKDFDSIKENREIETEDFQLLNDISLVLESNQNRRLNVSITSPVSLLKELFTVKGSGTLVKRGSKIQIFENWDGLDQSRLVQLIENSFQRKTKPKFIEEGFDSIILESDYKACALFRKTNAGILLSKFAVDEIARGEGVGREIWDKMKEIYPSLFWRARINNEISKWYMKEADGMIKQDKWIYFWIGESLENIPNIIHYLNSLQEDWMD